jgi:hypothetical protein
MCNRGICHNDLRPENILISADGFVTLIDFDQATRTPPFWALIRSFTGISIGQGEVHGSVLTVVKRHVKSRLSPRTIRVLKRMLRPNNGDGQRLPCLPNNASPQLRALLEGWRLAQKSDATSPDARLAYYSLEFEGVHLPGERPWMERFEEVLAATDYTGKRVLELGCNMALLSSFLLRDAGAAAALAVDVDDKILKAAQLVASALSVTPALRQVDLDDSGDWETPLSDFEPDIVFALNVLNWVQDKDRLMSFLGRFDEVIFEGHETPEVEAKRFRDVGFQRIDLLGISERGRPLLRCRK